MHITKNKTRVPRRSFQILQRSSLALVPTLLVASCTEKKPPQRPTPVVAVTKASKGPLPYIVNAPGEVEPNRSVAVQSQVSGMLTRVSFTEGDEVRQGQVLFEIDSRPFRAELQRVTGTLTRDEAQLAQAKGIVTRYAALAKDGYATREQMDQVNANAAALEATVSADKATVEAARLALDEATVRAPIGGRTGQLAIKAGNQVRALADPPLVTINEVRPVMVRFAIPERDFAQLRARSGINAALDATIRPGTASDSLKPIVGKLAFIDNAIDRTTGAVTLKAKVGNADGALWPGQFVNVALELAVDSNAVTVPTQAVVTTQTGTFVFVVDEAKKAHRTPVKVGRTSGLIVVIDEGLSGGETVITDGQNRLNDGATVEIRSLAPRNTDAPRGQRAGRGAGGREGGDSANAGGGTGGRASGRQNGGRDSGGRGGNSK